MTQIYFACAITSGRDYAHVYQDIVDIIKANGAQVLSELFADMTITSETGVAFKKGMSDNEIWAWDMDWVHQADAIIAEVSLPSLGVGYEIGTAYALNKPVLALYHKRPDKHLSAMISGGTNVTVNDYADIKDTEPMIKQFLNDLETNP